MFLNARLAKHFHQMVVLAWSNCSPEHPPLMRFFKKILDLFLILWNKTNRIGVSSIQNKSRQRICDAKMNWLTIKLTKCNVVKGLDSWHLCSPVNPREGITGYFPPGYVFCQFPLPLQYGQVAQKAILWKNRTNLVKNYEQFL